MTKLEEWRMLFGHTKVLARSNDEEPYLVGALVGFTTGSGFPQVKVDKDIYTCMGVVVPWSEKLGTLLDTLTYEEQWDLLSQISLAVQITKEYRC